MNFIIDSSISGDHRTQEISSFRRTRFSIASPVSGISVTKRRFGSGVSQQPPDKLGVRKLIPAQQANKKVLQSCTDEFGENSTMVGTLMNRYASTAPVKLLSSKHIGRSEEVDAHVLMRSPSNKDTGVYRSEKGISSQLKLRPMVRHMSKVEQSKSPTPNSFVPLK